MTAFFFERPIEMAIVLGIVWGLILLLWLLTRLKVWKRTLLVSGVFVVLLPIVNIVYKTKSEQVEVVLEKMFSDIQKKNLAAVLPYIDKKYNDHSINYSFLKKNIKRLGQWKLDELKWKILKIKMQADDNIQILFSASGQAIRAGHPTSFKKTIWKIFFKKSSKNSKSWSVYKIKPLEFNLHNRPKLDNLKDMFQMRI